MGLRTVIYAQKLSPHFSSRKITLPTTKKIFLSLFMAIQKTVERKKFYPLTSPKEKIIQLNTRNFDCLQKINLSLHLYKGLHKASYNQISKSFFTYPKETIKRLSGKIFIPLLIQRKNRAPLCAEKQKRPTHPHTTKRGVQSASRLVRIVHVCISL